MKIAGLSVNRLLFHLAAGIAGGVGFGCFTVGVFETSRWSSAEADNGPSLYIERDRSTRQSTES
jgi:hypothetical protein